METIDSFKAAIEAGQKLTNLHKLDDGRTLVTAPHIPGGHVIVPAAKAVVPRFLTAEPMFHDVVAFIAYVNEFKDSWSRIFFNEEGLLVAVLDYHKTAESCQRHGDHIAKLQLVRSPEWKVWIDANQDAMDQREFAEFLEDNTRDLLEPDPTVMMQVATGLQAKVGATFRRAINQANGQMQVQWDENIEAKVDGGSADIPTTFVIGLRPFMGTAPRRVECRLRYRISGGSLAFHFKALDLEWITESALTGVIDKVRDETGITPALGAHDFKAFLRGT